jgi:hypothetical protein
MIEKRVVCSGLERYSLKHAVLENDYAGPQQGEEETEAAAGVEETLQHEEEWRSPEGREGLDAATAHVTGRTPVRKRLKVPVKLRSRAPVWSSGWVGDGDVFGGLMMKELATAMVERFRLCDELRAMAHYHQNRSEGLQRVNNEQSQAHNLLARVLVHRATHAFAQAAKIAVTLAKLKEEAE